MNRKKSNHHLAEEQEREREYHRRWAIVTDLAALEVRYNQTGQYSAKLTDESIADVIAVCQRHGMLSWDFRHLDEKPGYYGYRVGPEQREWHWKLRQVRNYAYDQLAAAFADADPEEV